MRISRAWATPVTIGVFAIMAVTGVLLFFRIHSGLNKVVHEWAGLVLIAGVILHVAVNWRAFQNYFLSGFLGRSIIGLGVVVLAASFLPLAPPKTGGSAAGVMAVNAIASAPIASVASLAGKPVDQVLADLAAAGIVLAGPEATIKSVTAEDRPMQNRAVGVLFGGRGADKK